MATFTGLLAKENIVATFGILYSFGGALSESGEEIWGLLAADFTQVAALSFLIFNLLCAPCFAAIGAIKREMNSAKWTWLAICYQTLFAYVISLIVFQIGSAVTGDLNVVGLTAAIALLALMAYMVFRPYKKSDKN